MQHLTRWPAQVVAKVGIVAVVAAIWLPQLFTSLWLDELGTAWVLRPEVGATWQAAWETHGQSPLTYLVVWSSRQWLGGAEWQLRFLPFLFSLASLPFVWLVARRLVGADGAWVTALVYAVHPGVILLSAQARPYPLALLAFAAATWFLLRWLEAPRGHWWIAYVVAVTVVVWSHYVLAAGLLAHPLMYWWLERSERASPGRYAAAVAASLFLCAPLVGQVVSLADRSDELFFGNALSVSAVLGFSVPVVLAAGLGLAWWLSGRGVIDTTIIERGPWRSIGALAFVPPATLVAVSWATDAVPLASRYFSSGHLGIALAVGALVAAGSQVLRTGAAITILLLGLIVGSQASLATVGDDWRNALAFVAAQEVDALVLVNSGFVESRARATGELVERSDFVFAPVAYYEIPQEVRLLPPPSVGPQRIAGHLLEVRPEMLGHDEIIVISFQSAAYTAPVEVLLHGDGYEAVETPSFRGISVSRFVRAQP